MTSAVTSFALFQSSSALDESLLSHPIWGTYGSSNVQRCITYGHWCAKSSQITIYYTMQSSRTQVQPLKPASRWFSGKIYFDGTDDWPSVQPRLVTAWACSPACESLTITVLRDLILNVASKDIKVDWALTSDVAFQQGDFETRRQMESKLASVEARQRDREAKEKASLGGWREETGHVGKILCMNIVKIPKTRHWALWVQRILLILLSGAIKCCNKLLNINVQSGSH